MTETQFYLPDTFSKEESAIEGAIQAGWQKIDVDALINTGKQFRVMLYPGKTHGVSGKARIHLFHMIKDFLEENLK